MSAALKFVRHSTAGFVVWPAKYPGLTHLEVELAIRCADDVPRGEVLSAGFVIFDADGLPICNGRSDSLDVDSREDDTAALRAEWGMQAPSAPAPLNPAAFAEAQKFGAGLDDSSLEQPSEVL